MSISLVYLARGQGAGFDAANRFIDSYSIFQAGCEHELVVIMKGWAEVQSDDKKNIEVKFRGLGAAILELSDDGFDWGAYMRASAILETDFICFLNSFSRPLCHCWLQYIYQGIKTQDVGMCGVTAAYNSWRFTLPLFEFNFLSIVKYPLKVTRRLINHILMLGYYPSKFSPHIRSNGFAVKRLQFLDFVDRSPMPRTKRDCYKLESGVASYSDYILRLGQRLLLVDNKGNHYDIKDWIISKTYCCLGQPGLCIADNNTDSYDKKTRSGKKQMEFEAWGITLPE